MLPSFPGARAVPAHGGGRRVCGSTAPYDECRWSLAFWRADVSARVFIRLIGMPPREGGCIAVAGCSQALGTLILRRLRRAI